MYLYRFALVGSDSTVAMKQISMALIQDFQHNFPQICHQILSQSLSPSLYHFSFLIPTYIDVDCGLPPVLLNGNVTILKGTGVGSKATYYCNSKYTFAVSSSVERTCKSSGNWSDETIECGND